MAVKVVDGLIGKPGLETKPIQNTQAPSTAAQPASAPQSVQQAVATAVRSTDAVVSTLRSFRTQGASSEPIKDVKEAQKVATEVAEKIRGDKDGEATASHDGLSSGKSSPVLVN